MRKAGAYSWSNGTIYLSTGLLHLLSDDELCAVIAHEMGHLTPQSVMPNAMSPYALHGGTANDVEEQRADAVAVNILQRSGLRPTLLADVLEKVRDEPHTPANLHNAMTVRIGLLPRD